jgi:hypothetical protein
MNDRLCAAPTHVVDQIGDLCSGRSQLGPAAVHGLPGASSADGPCELAGPVRRLLLSMMETAVRDPEDRAIE